MGSKKSISAKDDLPTNRDRTALGGAPAFVSGVAAPELVAMGEGLIPDCAIAPPVVLEVRDVNVTCAGGAERSHVMHPMVNPSFHRQIAIG
jgi:hypothetical protein